MSRTSRSRFNFRMEDQLRKELNEATDVTGESLTRFIHVACRERLERLRQEKGE